MSDQRRRGKRTDRRAFRPGMDGQVALESRLLLSAAKGRTAIRQAPGQPSGRIRYNVAGSGTIARITDVDGEKYHVVVTNGGFVRARPLEGGRVALIVEATNSDSELAINPAIQSLARGTAHTYPAIGRGNNLLDVGAIRVKSGKIGQILGFRTANLSGPLVVRGTGAVSRIAFFNVRPGASIRTGGDLNTLNVFNDLSIGGGPSVAVGRDLDWVTVGGNLNIGAGSSFSVARDLGLTAQPAKGSDPGGQGGLVTGDVNIEPGASFVVGRVLQDLFLIDGSVQGGSRVDIAFGGGNFVSRGLTTG